MRCIFQHENKHRYSSMSVVCVCFSVCYIVIPISEDIFANKRYWNMNLEFLILLTGKFFGFSMCLSMSPWLQATFHIHWVYSSLSSCQLLTSNNNTSNYLSLINANVLSYWMDLSPTCYRIISYLLVTCNYWKMIATVIQVLRLNIKSVYLT